LGPRHWIDGELPDSIADPRTFSVFAKPRSRTKESSSNHSGLFVSARNRTVRCAVHPRVDRRGEFKVLLRRIGKESVMDTVKGAAIAAAVASMMGAGGCASEAPFGGGGDVLLYANACKGKSACKAGLNVQVEEPNTSTAVDKSGKNNSCKAVNACKGLGVAEEWELFETMFEI
jgi:hypothetical protein